MSAHDEQQAKILERIAVQWPTQGDEREAALRAGAVALRAQADAVQELEALRFWCQGEGRLGHVLERINTRLTALKGAS